MDPELHLLIVDDEEDFLLLIKEVLELEGFRVTVTSIASKAVEMVRDGLRPDVVLLDYRMPLLTGPEILANMRAHGMRSPAVLVSAICDIVETAQEIGFTDFLEKPFASADLVAVVRRVLAPDPAT